MSRDDSSGCHGNHTDALTFAARDEAPNPLPARISPEQVIWPSARSFRIVEERRTAAFDDSDGPNRIRNGMKPSARASRRSRRPAAAPVVFTADDVHAMLRLSAELHRAAPDAARAKRLLLEGICGIVRAQRALSVVTRIDDNTGGRSIVSVVSAGGIDATKDGAEGAWIDSLDVHELLRRQDVRHCIDSLVPLEGLRLVAWLLVGRRPRDRRFSPRDRAVLDVLHAESTWVYGDDLLLTLPEARRLSQRERQTLQHLLAGRNEKQIAAALRLSQNTVHHYVKTLYQHFRVSSRSELLARWIREDARQHPARPRDP